MRLQVEGGETVTYVPGSGGQPIAVPEAELWSSVRVAVRELRAPADPLSFAQLTFGLTEASGTYWYFPRSGNLLAESLGGGLEEAQSAASMLTGGYLGWCGGTRLGGGDCLHLLNRSQVLSLHGRYVVTLVMAMTASFGPMLDSLKELADPNSVAVMLASAVAVYLLLLLVPEPISKFISIGITAALIGYLGWEMFWSLVHGARALAREVDAATEFSQLRMAAVNFGKVLGPQMGQLLILLVSHSLGTGLTAKGKAPPPRFAEATAQTERLTRVRLDTASAGVRSVTLDSGAITISLTSGALMVGTPSGAGADTGPQEAGRRSESGETAPSSGRGSVEAKGDLQRRIKDAERALEKDKDFRRWFHREYKPGQKAPSGKRKNPDLSGEDVLDAHEEWIHSGKPKVK
ncbi:MAG TPA: hypothetical protein VFB81_20775 [Myxococcales bacterium]|nr:hypothetical protein [Myxococcales bacterium]